MRAPRSVFGFAAIAVIGLGWFETAMRPNGGERAQVALILGGMVAAAAAAVWTLPIWARRTRSVRHTVMLLSVTALGIAAGAVAVAASLMFLSAHDLTLVMVVLGVGVLAGVGFGVAVARPWAQDLESLAAAAKRVAAGDFSVRSGVTRRDEIGALAAGMDEMAERLAAAAAERTREESARREFLAAIGHDLRTPLTALQAAVEAVSDGVASDPDRYLNAMRRDIAALRALVDDLFLLAKIESGSLTFEQVDVDLTEVADEAIEVLQPVAAGRGVVVRLDADGRSIVRGGQEALGRVIRNLLDNAIRHAPDQTEVLVRVTNGDGGTVAITDAGPGLDPAYVDRAFVSFDRADPSRARDTGGAGLGLAIARGFVSAMGGKIWAEPGPGGKVAFRIPAS